MVINKFPILIVLTLCAFSVCAQNNWIGSYEFEEDGGKTAGGTPIFIVHQIDILESDDGLIAMIQSNGFQTSRELIASTKIESDKLSLFFDAYGENNTFQNYEKGNLLLALEMKVSKGKTELLTYWGKFQPVVPKNEKSGKVYFQKLETTLR